MKIEILTPMQHHDKAPLSKAKANKWAVTVVSA